jgi:hypothetical protein
VRISMQVAIRAPVRSAPMPPAGLTPTVDTSRHAAVPAYTMTGFRLTCIFSLGVFGGLEAVIRPTS